MCETCRRDYRLYRECWPMVPAARVWATIRWCHNRGDCGWMAAMYVRRAAEELVQS